MPSSRPISTGMGFKAPNVKFPSLAILLACLIGFVLTGCDTDKPSPTTPPGTSDATTEQNQTSLGREIAEGFPATFVDRLDRKVTLAEPPERIISLSPSTTELLFALGAGSKLVGRTEYCTFPNEALQVPVVGKGTIEGISRESILAANPDVILFKWDSHQALIATFEPLGIPLIGIGPESIEELLEEASLLGRMTGTELSARDFIVRFQLHLREIQQSVAAIGPSQRAKVFYEVWDDPLMTAGPDSFIGQLLTLANVENVFSDVQSRYPRVSSEVLLQRNPDVILAPTTHSQKVDVKKMASRPGWAGMRAVENQRIHVIDGDLISRCGPRMLDALEEIIRIVYPEVAPKIGNKEQVDAPGSKEPMP